MNAGGRLAPGRERAATGGGAGERGSASVVVGAVMGVLVVLAIGVADVARVLGALAQAQTAADAAALAAVQEQAIPSGLGPEVLAAEYAAHNGAELASCVCEAGAFESAVTVRVAVGPLFLLPDDRVVLGRARAVVDLPGASAPPAPTGP